ncbi:hypothetical protein MmiEs2_04430 [Methanimicrococcus stummii]|uniref:Chromosome segregation protein SMC n=1 Tax=Methanimicrococcus stummii TaxID=3028294 RepID=A0AA96V7Z1_9EURY|nr:AAA family ATPase [Methanimicrococcus sp. Es2]WNY28259.1 hypothetical protein MmiEs2_04430 [Methanimicrococcus sp. Es2]
MLNENQITNISISGFKSIKATKVELKNLNVLIGSNGAGKSNFISIFDMLQSIIDEKLKVYVGVNGRNSLLYTYKDKKAEEINVEFRFGNNGYNFSLIPTSDHNLIFQEESFYWNLIGNYYLPAGGTESNWKKGTGTDIDAFIQPIFNNLKWRIFHFHDVGNNAPVKQQCRINDNIEFTTNARNIAAFLYRLKNSQDETEKQSYTQIVNFIRYIAPFFEDFILVPSRHNSDLIYLEWKSWESDIPFGVSQLSDGTIRFICLAVLLLQPEKLQPETIIIDEPELGLHPAAIAALGSLIQTVSQNKQIIISTQSVELLDQFNAEDIIVVDRVDNSSVFRRLDSKELKIWLEDDYSLSELWNKNIIGGRPSE